MIELTPYEIRILNDFNLILTCAQESRTTNELISLTGFTLKKLYPKCVKLIKIGYLKKIKSKGRDFKYTQCVYLALVKEFDVKEYMQIVSRRKQGLYKVGESQKKKAEQKVSELKIEHMPSLADGRYIHNADTNNMREKYIKQSELMREERKRDRIYVSGIGEIF
jgi:hypothetical protein